MSLCEAESFVCRLGSAARPGHASAPRGNRPAMKRYSVFAIAREALRWHQGWERAWAAPEPQRGL